MNDEYKLEHHNFNMKLRGTAYQYCCKCGLVAMKNDFSQWHQRMGCNAHDHPNYERERVKTSCFK